MDKILTVVVPSYNVEATLSKTVDSFLDKSILDRIEIVIVNDGSEDKTAYIAENYAVTYPGIVRHAYKRNGGHGSAINRGLSIASGKYFKVVDGDDWVDTEEFVKFVHKLEDIDADVVFTPYNEVHITDNSIIRRAVSGVDFGKIYNIDEQLVAIGDCYQMHSVTFRTQLIKDKLAITEKCFYVDQEYILLPLKSARTICYLDNTIYQYRLGDTNQSVSIASKQKNRSMHKKVLDRLMSEYKDWSVCSDGLRTFLLRRFAGLAQIQVDIYLTMSDREQAKKEFMEFWKYLKKSYNVVYKSIEGRSAKVMRIMPALGFNIAYKRMQEKI